MDWYGDGSCGMVKVERREFGAGETAGAEPVADGRSWGDVVSSPEGD